MAYCRKQGSSSASTARWRKALAVAQLVDLDYCPCSYSSQTEVGEEIFLVDGIDGRKTFAWRDGVVYAVVVDVDPVHLQAL